MESHAKRVREWREANAPMDEKDVCQSRTSSARSRHALSARELRCALNALSFLVKQPKKAQSATGSVNTSLEGKLSNVSLVEVRPACDSVCVCGWVSLRFFS